MRLRPNCSRLNPSLLRLSTPKEGTFELHLPAGTKEQYQTAIAAIPAGMRLWWRYPTVHSGDTLASLARAYRTTAKSIAEANHLDGTANYQTDAKLIIPVAPGKHSVSDTATYARRITRYKVRKGDTVQTVAENFGVSAQMIRRWNGLRGDSLHGRTVLALHLPVTPNRRTELDRLQASQPVIPGRAHKRPAPKLPAAKSAKPSDRRCLGAGQRAPSQSEVGRNLLFDRHHLQNHRRCPKTQQPKRRHSAARHDPGRAAKPIEANGRCKTVRSQHRSLKTGQVAPAF